MTLRHSLEGEASGGGDAVEDSSSIYVKRFSAREERTRRNYWLTFEWMDDFGPEKIMWFRHQDGNEGECW